MKLQQGGILSARTIWHRSYGFFRDHQEACSCYDVRLLHTFVDSDDSGASATDGNIESDIVPANHVSVNDYVKKVEE